MKHEGRGPTKKLKEKEIVNVYLFTKTSSPRDLPSHGRLPKLRSKFSICDLKAVMSLKSYGISLEDIFTWRIRRFFKINVIQEVLKIPSSNGVKSGEGLDNDTGHNHEKWPPESNRADTGLWGPLGLTEGKIR